MRSQTGASASTSRGDVDGAGLVECAVIAEGCQVQLERLALDDPFVRHIVDDQMGEIRLARERAQRREFGAGETHQIDLAGVRVGHGLQHRLLGRRRNIGRLAKLGERVGFGRR